MVGRLVGLYPLFREASGFGGLVLAAMLALGFRPTQATPETRFKLLEKTDSTLIAMTKAMSNRLEQHEASNDSLNERVAWLVQMRCLGMRRHAIKLLNAKVCLGYPTAEDTATGRVR
jgi:hypothetical protein